MREKKNEDNNDNKSLTIMNYWLIVIFLALAMMSLNSPSFHASVG